MPFLLFLSVTVAIKDLMTFNSKIAGDHAIITLFISNYP